MKHFRSLNHPEEAEGRTIVRAINCSNSCLFVLDDDSYLYFCGDVLYELEPEKDESHGRLMMKAGMISEDEYKAYLVKIGEGKIAEERKLYEQLKQRFEDPFAIALRKAKNEERLASET